MRKILALTAAAALVAVSAAASAEDVAAAAPAAAFVAKTGQIVMSSDGKRIGRIDRVDAARVGIIVDMKYVYVPLASLSAGANGRAVTALSYKDAVSR